MGDDTKAGTTPATAWRTLEAVNAHVFRPGDQLLFKASTRYLGQLAPKGSGAVVDGKVRAIKIGRYGEGTAPRIDGAGEVLDTLLLRNVEYWEVKDLELTNLGTNRAAGRTGARVEADGSGTIHHIWLRNLFVHDVNSDLRKQREGCGIFFESRGGESSRFDDLLIENCHVKKTDRNGICQRAGRGSRSAHVVIRGNLLEDIGGDGIKLWGSNGGLIESNVLRGGRMRCEDYAAGIWPFDCDDTIIQYNEVSGMKGIKDGQAFDSDYVCRRSLFQYNYSHDNEGGFFLICAPGNSWNEDTIIRYNLSTNDGLPSSRIFQFGGGASNTLVYNNTIVSPSNQVVPLLSFNSWDGGNARDTRFVNNIFIAPPGSRLTFDWDRSTNNFFDHNAFIGDQPGRPEDSNAVTNGFENAVGAVISNNGGRDFFGNPVPANRPPMIGACQARR